MARDPLFPFRLSQALCVGTIEKDVRPEFVWLSTLRSERVLRLVLRQWRPRGAVVLTNSACCHTRPVFFSFVFINSFKVVSASAGGSHCLFLTSSGRVYGMGTNAQGRLGLNHSVHACRSPEFVSSLGKPVPLATQAARAHLTNSDTHANQSISTSLRWRPVFSVVLHLPKRCVIPLLSGSCVSGAVFTHLAFPGLNRFPRARCSPSAATQTESSVWGPTRRP